MHERDSLRGRIKKILNTEELPEKHISPPYFTTGVLTTGLSAYDVANGDIKGTVINVGVALASFDYASMHHHRQRRIDYDAGVEAGKQNVDESKEDPSPQNDDSSHI